MDGPGSLLVILDSCRGVHTEEPHPSIVGAESWNCGGASRRRAIMVDAFGSPRRPCVQKTGVFHGIRKGNSRMDVPDSAGRQQRFLVRERV